MKLKGCIADMKNRVFINFSNHPSDKWEIRQIEAAKVYGEIIDLPFPEVDETKGESYIANLADEYVEKILNYEPEAVLCQGEFTLAFAVITALKEQKVDVLAACSRRVAEEHEGKKISVFSFERFRRY